MKTFKTPVLACTLALLLAACGGGGSDSGTGTAQTLGSDSARRFTSVVSFGDSLSDTGTYKPATVLPGFNPPVYLGGKFTTNSDTSTIWVENIAASLGLVVTPAEVGFAGQSLRCPAASVGLATTCTAYGQGGARVTDPNGTRHDAGALTVPVKTQIANHLKYFDHHFRSTDLIFVWAGANDLLWQVEKDPSKNPDSFVVKLFQAQALASQGMISPEQAQSMVQAAQVASQAAMKQAALELAFYIRRDILGRGGRRVVVLNLPDPVVTPEGAATAAFSPVLGAAMTSFADTFNAWLKEALSGLPVQQIDIRRFISDVVAHPALHDMVNTAVPACDPELMSRITGGAVTDGFALFCNATPNASYNGLRLDADVNSWFFADGNHPTTGGHRLISDEVLRKLNAAGWLREKSPEDQS